MKFKGKTIAPPSPVKVEIFRDSGNVMILCGAVLGSEEFDALCPEPKAPVTTDVSTGAQRKKTEDKSYIERLATHNKLYVAFTMLKSLQATPDLEWETVDLTKPDTWLNYEVEMKKVFTQGEINRITSGVWEANNPTSSRRQEALDSFTGSQLEGSVPEPISPAVEPTITQSTEPANV